MRRVIATTATIALALGIAGTARAAGSSSPGETSRAGSAATASSDQVKQSQQELKSGGYYNGPVDGVMGRGTRQALSRYQKKEGLRQTATLDRETLQRLTQNPSAGSGSSGAPPSTDGGMSPTPPSAPSPMVAPAPGSTPPR